MSNPEFRGLEDVIQLFDLVLEKRMRDARLRLAAFPTAGAAVEAEYVADDILPRRTAVRSVFPNRQCLT